MRVVITGAARGIGRATAKAFARDGYELILVDNNEGGLKSTRDEVASLASSVNTHAIDITDDAAVASIFGKYDRIDSLINCAGIFRIEKLENLTKDNFRKMYEINLIALFDISMQAVAKMSAGGAIVNFASRAMLGARGCADYSASKGAVAGLTRNMALELASKGIRVNAIAPGVIETEMVTSRPDTNLDALRALQPMGEIGQPEDVAEAALFLGTARAKYISGQILVIDGGRSIGGTMMF